MKNDFYQKGKELILDGDLVPLEDTIRWALVDRSYVPDRETDCFLSDIPESAIVGISDALRGKTLVEGVFYADSVEVRRAPLGRTIAFQVLYKDTGRIKTSRLIGLLDDAPYLPCEVWSKTITITHQGAPNGVFSIGEPQGVECGSKSPV